MTGPPLASPQSVREALIARREIALLDLREEADFARGHPLFAAQLPLSRLELEILDRVPHRNTPIVLYDAGEGLAERGQDVLARLGYADVRVLDGGLSGWRDAGFELFIDVNSYAKAFGELVAHRRGTLSLAPEQVKAMIAAGADVVVMDARPFGEFEVMSIPGAVNVPGGELVLRARELAPSPATRIVVNCAGRTRSLIGAQSLINAGLPNPVAALRNGTIGWTLAGLELEHGARRTYPDGAPASLAAAQAASGRAADAAGVRRLSAAGLAGLAAEAGRTLYRFDVRAEAEFEAGRPAGFRPAPGGQLVQEIDVFAPVRGARIVLYDDLRVRAEMTAAWLAQMNWEVYVLEPAGADATVTGPWRPSSPALPDPPGITVEALARRLADGAAVPIDLATSREHRRRHIPGAWFAIRSQLAQALARLPDDGDLVFTSPDGALARLAAAEVQGLAGRNVYALAGGTRAWAAAGQPVATGLTHVASEPVDLYKRPYEGVDNGAEAMRAYLEWEYGLVAQLERDGTHGFHVV